MTVEQIGFSPEKPLNKGSAFALACAAGATILLFYLFVVAGLLFLLSLLVCELLFVVAMARFGLAASMARLLTRHMAPLPIFFRSFWIRKGSEFHLDLQPEAAPRLFEMLRALCRRANVAQPREVRLEMSVNAWVRLDGYRRGTGKTALGLGYDLLAGLSETEIEAILAHELTHARLVQRGLNHWLRRGLNRAARLAGGLADLVEVGRKTRQPAELALILLRPADWLARTCSRLVAACSRQDEFAADRGAAELCGTEAMRSALLKLEPIGRTAARLPWRERVAQIQMGQGFSQWLAAELTSAQISGNGSQIEAKAAPFNKYATHPSLTDRLAALPPGNGSATNSSSPAIKLLADPERIAEQLITEIQRVIALEEQKDSKALNRWGRKIRSHSCLSPLQSLGLLAAIIGSVGGIVYWLTAGMSAGLLGFMTATIVPGMLCYRFEGRRESIALPVPSFTLLNPALQTNIECTETKTREIEATLYQQAVVEKKIRRKARFFAKDAYASLERCDYFRAHVAARLCLQLDKNSLEGMIALAVSGAALGQPQQATKALQAIQKRTRITHGSAAWGTAWALMLLANWSQAEAFLQIARKGRSENPTLLTLLALCQARRGKLQSAILSARQSCSLVPGDKEIAKTFIALLLDGGFLREAEEQLCRFKNESTTDSELMFSMVRLNLMVRNTQGAEEWSQRMKCSSAGARTLLRLGGAYESCRQEDQAAKLYIQTLSGGHYPEALLCLGRMEAAKRNGDAARGHLLAALDLERTPAADSCGPLQIFQAALEQLVSLQQPASNCVAWIATLKGRGIPEVLANKSMMVVSPSRQEAEGWLSGLLKAMHPSRPPVLPNTIAWKQAPQEQQPFGLARPGVLGVL